VTGPFTRRTIPVPPPDHALSLFGRLLVRLLALLRRPRADIGRGGVPLFTRWTLLGQRFGPGHKLFLHRFWRSDPEPCHSHPWAFWALVLWPGYCEVLPGGWREWHAPLSLLRRAVTCVHRVEMGPAGYCWSLVWAGNKVQSWGFICRDGRFVPWPQADANADAGLGICGDAPGRAVQ
jgi:hypothetical protein